MNVRAAGALRLFKGEDPFGQNAANSYIHILCVAVAIVAAASRMPDELLLSFYENLMSRLYARIKMWIMRHKETVYMESHGGAREHAGGHF